MSTKTLDARSLIRIVRSGTVAAGRSSLPRLASAEAAAAVVATTTAVRIGVDVVVRFAVSLDLDVDRCLLELLGVLGSVVGSVLHVGCQLRGSLRCGIGGSCRRLLDGDLGRRLVDRCRCVVGRRVGLVNRR